MGGRSATTYKKRQKELARQDKQREKIARRAQRKLEKQSGVPEGAAIEPAEEIPPGEEGLEGDSARALEVQR